MPGTSKMMAAVLLSARRNGLASCQLAPIPLNSSNGGRPGGRRVVATRSGWRPTSIVRTSMPSPSTSLLLEDIRARRRRTRTMTRVAQCGWSRHFVARTLIKPVTPMRPPAALVPLARAQEGVRAVLSERAGGEGGFRIAGRVEQALQMTAVRQDECRILAHDPGCPIHRLPRRDVIGHASDDIAVDLDLFHVDRGSVERELVGIYER